MWLIPGKTKLRLEIFKGVGLTDILIGVVFAAILGFLAFSNLPFRWIAAVIILLIGAFLLARIDEEPNYLLILHLIQYLGYPRDFRRKVSFRSYREQAADENAAGAYGIDGRAVQADPYADQDMEDPYADRDMEDPYADQDMEDPYADRDIEDPYADRDMEDPYADQDMEDPYAEDSFTEDSYDDLSEAENEEADEDAGKRRRKHGKLSRKKEDRKSKKAKKKDKGKSKKAEKSEKEDGKSKKEKKPKKPKKEYDMERIVAFTDIRDNVIDYNGKYYGAVLEIPPVEFRLFSEARKRQAIVNGLGKVLRSLSSDYSVNIVKLERPVHYESYRENELKKLEDLRNAYEDNRLTEEELQIRVEIIYERIGELDQLSQDGKVITPFYYFVLFNSDRRRLEVQLASVLDDLKNAELSPVRLRDRELALFLKYSNSFDVDEKEIDELDPEDYAEWAMPETLNVRTRRLEMNGIITHVMRVNRFPAMAGDAWLATVMSMPGTKVILKCHPMDTSKAVRNIDRSLAELRSQLHETGIDSRKLELQQHINSLTDLLATLQGDNETLMETNIYVTVYDAVLTETQLGTLPENTNLPRITNMKKVVRQTYSENGFRLKNIDFEQLKAFIASQVSAYDPFTKEGRGIPTNSISASYPWVFANVCDENGVKLGTAEGVPVFMDFFKRDTEHVNSNMVIVGKSGSGKSYATKAILSNLAADNAKIFILDPENEYAQLAENLHGKFINVGNAVYGRLNPFQIMTALEDDETDGSSVSGSYATHLQFLEEFFRQILPDCEKDALEYLNNIVDRMYLEYGISAETDLSRLKPEDYPVFDNLYDAILQEFQQTDNEFIRTMLRTLMNYISKFSEGGRNANIWNGPSTVTTDENFTVFNFQSLLSNRNQTIANAQMLLVLKYIDNEIIKNREYNTRYHRDRKIVVVIDEAHVFIDTKFPIALDFMFQLAKRIRKYNGMQIVITQNIKDFVGSEEIARKSTAIINACQYSFIFSLAPNDISDLCKLYEKAGGINDIEQNWIMSAGRGQTFAIQGPTMRSTFRMEVPESVREMFEEENYVSKYFVGDIGAGYWADFLGDSREIHDERAADFFAVEEEKPEEEHEQSFVHFRELSGEEADEAIHRAQEDFLKKKAQDNGRAFYGASDGRVTFEEADEGTVSGGQITFEEVDEEPVPAGQVNFGEVDEEEMPVGRVAFAETDEEHQRVPGVKSQDRKREEAAGERISVGTTSTDKGRQPAASSPSDTEQMLIRLLSEMNHQNMELRIQQAVTAEVERRIGTILSGSGQGIAAVTAQAGTDHTADVRSVEDIRRRGSASTETDDEELPELLDLTDTEEEENRADDLFGDGSGEGSDDLFGDESGEGLDDLFGDESGEGADNLFGDESDDSDDLFGRDEEDASESRNSSENDDNLDDDDFLADLLGGSDEDEDEDDDSFDLLSLLSSDDEENEEDSSVIDEMDIYEEEVIDITLEDLRKYVQNQVKMRMAAQEG